MPPLTDSDDFHDLVRLRGTDPAGPVPDWAERRARLRARVLSAASPAAARPSHAAPHAASSAAPRPIGSPRPGWRAPLAASVAGLVVVGSSVAVLAADHGRQAVVGVPAATPERTGSAVPGEPSERSAGPATTPVPAGAIRITGTAPLQQRPGESIKLCVGQVGYSVPLSCPTTVAVSQLSWDRVPWAREFAGTTEAVVTVTGIWSDDVLAVETVSTPVTETPPEEPPLPQLCATPTGTPTERGPDSSPVTALPGYQAMWVTHPTTGRFAGKTVYNLAVTGDPGAAERALRATFDGPLCVGTVPGPTYRDREAGRDRVWAEQAELGILGAGIGSLTGGHTGLEFRVFLETDEVRARIDELVGPTLVEWTSLRGQFHPA